MCYMPLASNVLPVIRKGQFYGAKFGFYGITVGWAKVRQQINGNLEMQATWQPKQGKELPSWQMKHKRQLSTKGSCVREF